MFPRAGGPPGTQAKTAPEGSITRPGSDSRQGLLFATRKPAAGERSSLKAPAGQPRLPPMASQGQATLWSERREYPPASVCLPPPVRRVQTSTQGPCL